LSEFPIARALSENRRSRIPANYVRHVILFSIQREKPPQIPSLQCSAESGARQSGVVGTYSLGVCDVFTGAAQSGVASVLAWASVSADRSTYTRSPGPCRLPDRRRINRRPALGFTPVTIPFKREVNLRGGG